MLKQGLRTQAAYVVMGKGKVNSLPLMLCRSCVGGWSPSRQAWKGPGKTWRPMSACSAPSTSNICSRKRRQRNSCRQLGFALR